MKYAQKRNMILEGKISKVIITLALPIMLNNFIQTLYNLADSYWVSKLGAIEFAATTFVFPVLFLIISFGLGISVAGTALISQYVGSNQRKEANTIAGQIFTFSIILSILLGTIGFLFTPTIIRFMGATGDLFLFSKNYLQIMFLDIPILYIGFVFNAIRQGQGDTLTPMIINAGSVILNIILDPLFIFTFKLGVSGAAIATVLSKAIFIVYILYILFVKKEGIHITKVNLKPQRELLIKIIKVGFPASIGQAGASLGFILLNAFVLSYGEFTLAAFGIGNRINSLVLMPVMGIGNAIASIIGQNLGSNNIKRAKEVFKTSLFISIPLMLLGGILLFNISDFVIKIFTDESEVISQGSYFIKVLAFSLPLMAIFQALIGVFQGSGHTTYSMFLSMGRLWFLRIPMILLFKNFTELGSKGIWYAMLLSNLVIAFIGFLIYLKGAWQSTVMIKKSITETKEEMNE